MIIDITNQMRSEIKSLLPEADVTTKFQEDTPVFPVVTVDELSNDTVMESFDTAGEHHNDVVLEIEIFTTGGTKMNQSFMIRQKIDGLLSGTYRMRRVFSSATPNFADTNVYRYTLRYAFKIDENKTIYRR